MSHMTEIQPAPQVRELSVGELEHVSGAFLMQQAMASLKQVGEMLSNVSKARHEMSMAVIRNLR